jgi:hypothetical protein
MRHFQRTGVVIFPRSARVRLWTASLLTAAIAGACAPGATLPRGTDRSASVEVENQAFLDVNVYVVRSSQRIRLGTVTGHSTRVFAVPSNLVGTGAMVRFLADFIGSDRTPISEEMVIWPGDRVELTIPAS